VSGARRGKMATFLDVTLLKSFSGIFTWLLVWVISFGVLEWVHPFGKDKKGLNAIIAFSLAFLVLFTEPARFVIEFAVPWLTVLAIALFFLMFVFMSFGVQMKTITEWAEGPMQGWIVTISIVILLFALGGAFGPMVNKDIIWNEGVVEPIIDNETGEIIQPTSYGGPVTRGLDTRPARKNTFAENAVLTFTHPKVLGAIFLLILGTVTITFLSKQN